MVGAIARVLITWSLDTLYFIVYILSLGTKTIHEGTFFSRLNTYVNWNVDYHNQPAEYVSPVPRKPFDYSEIKDIVRRSAKVRVVGGGHSFNSGPLCDTLMLSLDNYKNYEINTKDKTVRVQAGIRLRDFIKIIEANGLDLPTLGSTNAQSLGGLVATDLHGTRKTQGYLSDQIKSVTVIDYKGEQITLAEGSDELRAVCGAIGALGVVVEMTIQCVPKYRLEKKITIVQKSAVEPTVEELLDYHDHMSFYYIGGVNLKTCRMNTWDETIYETSFLYKWRHFVQEIFDFILCSFILGIGRFTNKLDKFGPVGMMVMKFFMNRSLIGGAGGSFSRQLFYRHDEIEYGIPRDRFVPVMQELQQLLLSKECRSGSVTIIEVRFGGSSTSLIGPGSNRETVFIELAPSLTADPEPVFREAEKLFKRYGGKPHLGKWTTATPEYMREVHGDHFDTFLKIRKQFDPQGKFANPFTNQVFGQP